MSLARQVETLRNEDLATYCEKPIFFGAMDVIRRGKQETSA